MGDTQVRSFSSGVCISQPESMLWLVCGVSACLCSSTLLSPSLPHQMLQEPVLGTGILTNIRSACWTQYRLHSYVTCLKEREVTEGHFQA